MDSVAVHFQIPEGISSGLKSKAYERVGGVIRDSQTKQIVAMLRETTPNLSQASTILSHFGSVASLLNVAISVVGFVIIAKRLDVIERKIDGLQESLNDLHYKYDLSVDANFRAALKLAENSLTMRNQANRSDMSRLAISRFLEIQHIYTGYLDTALENNIQIAEKYFQFLSFSYVAATRCYLELEEIECAYRCIEEGTDLLKTRSDKCIKGILKSHARMSETERHYLGVEMVIRGTQERLRKTFLPFMPSAITPEDAERMLKVFNSSGEREKEFECWEKARDIAATCEYFEGYQAEIKSLKELEISFQNWQKLSSSISSPKKGADLMYIVPSQPIVIDI